MNKFALSLLTFCLPLFISGQAVITNVFDGPLTGGTPKGVEIYMTGDVDDPTSLGISSANNGNGATGAPEFSLPDGNSLRAGTYLYIATESEGFEDFFGFRPDYTTDAMLINGDDAVELFLDGAVIDVFGDVNTDGTGTTWEYMDGWASRAPGTGPDGSTFVEANWTFSGIDALDGETNNASAAKPVPLATYAVPSPDVTIDVSGLEFTPNKIVIDLNQTVGWQNTGGLHNVNGSLDTYPDNPEGFYSGDPKQDPWTFQHTFTQPGVYDYQCDQHASLGMTGVIVVRPVADQYVTAENNFFDPEDITITEGETVCWTNISGIHNVNGSTTSYPDNPEGFSNGLADNDWVFSNTFNIPGHYDYHCDPHLDMGMVGTVTVENKYTQVTMAELHDNDADGITTWDGQFVEVTGVAYGENLRPGGLQFALIDAMNRGVTVFSDAGDLGYEVAEGDELTVRGQVDQFNGLVQIVPDEIEMLSSGAPLVDPLDAQTPTEETEGSLVRIADLSLVMASEWPAAGTSANVRALSGTDTVTIRIDDEVDAGPVPMGSFNLTGISGQFDSDLPYDAGYQILPRRASDVDPVTAVDDLFSTGLARMFPNPAADLLHLECEQTIRRVFVYNTAGTLIHTVAPGRNICQIQVSEWVPGRYVILLQTDDDLGYASFSKF